MNSIHRVGLAIASFAALLTLAGSLVVESLTAAPAVQAGAAEPSSDATPTAPPSLDPVTIYINPVPTPALVTVTTTPPPDRARRRARATAAPAQNYGDDDGGGD